MNRQDNFKITSKKIINHLLISDMRGLTSPNQQSDSNSPIYKQIQTLIDQVKIDTSVTNNFKIINNFLQSAQNIKPQKEDLMAVRRIATVHRVYQTIHQLIQQAVQELTVKSQPEQLIVDVVHHRFKNLFPLLKVKNEYLELLKTKVTKIINNQKINELSGLEFEVDNLLKNYVHCLLSVPKPNEDSALKLSWFIIGSKISHRFFRVWLHKFPPNPKSKPKSSSVLTKEPPKTGKPKLKK